MKIITENVYNEETGLETNVRCISLPSWAVRAGVYKGLDLNLMLTIVASMDEQGKSHITQKELADITGLSIATINKKVNKILQSRVDGKPLMYRNKVSKGNGLTSVYTLGELPIPIKDEVSQDFEITEELEEKYNSATVMDLWCKLYKDKYDVVYTGNIARDRRQVKDAIVERYDKETVEKVMPYVFDNYHLLGNVKKYPRPTVSALCMFLFENAEAKVRRMPVTEIKSEEQLEVERAREDEIARRYF